MQDGVIWQRHQFLALEDIKHATYNQPMVRMNKRAIFCLRGIWRSQMVFTGRAAMIKSVAMFTPALQ